MYVEDRVRGLLEERDRLEELEAELRGQKELLNAELQQYAESFLAAHPEVKTWKVADHDIRVQVRAGNRTIKAELLLARGVAPQVIAEATVQAPDSKPFLVVVRSRGAGDTGTPGALPRVQPQSPRR